MCLKENLNMSKKCTLFNALILAALILSLIPANILAGPPPAPYLQASTAPLPLVAIHVSEYTQALDTGGMWYTSWHYFVMYESLKEALRSDGTPFVEISDAQIAAGALFHPDGSPRYPILISLASEAIHDNEIAPLRDYVTAGGFLFVGSSAFTRYPDGSTRGDFVLADEMGLHVLNPDHSQNWYQNMQFTKVLEHRLVSHIPWGTMTWRMPLHSEEIPWGVTGAHSTHGNHYVWRVTPSDAEVIANGGSGPLLATKSYGQGRFVYHGALNPLIGHGGNDPGMYAYVIYRNAIEWAFEAANLPIVKLSPWRYEYDAAFVVRHDFENTPSRIQSIEASAQAEQSVGAKGDYYFCTGTLREHMGDPSATVASLQRAVSLYGATIGSHNGGLVNPVNPTLPTSSYDYWHWGPDEALDVDPATLPPGYSDGYEYAQTSVSLSFQDIEGWLAGQDNGRTGCGAAGNCPRTWVSPYFNSAREGSYDILEDLGAVTMGEQKLSPFPHWTVSYETNERHTHVTLPTSDWYIGTNIAQSLESGHDVSTVHALVDFYHELGALVNLYGHSSSTSGVQWEYVNYSASRPRMWATNAVGVYDWWVSRSPVNVTPSYSKVDGTAITDASITGATDPETAIEMVVPHWDSGAISDLQVFLDGAPADPADYRTTDYGVKVRVGTAVSGVEVRYTPLEGWVQTDWDGGAGQAIWADETRYDSASGIDDSFDGQVRLSIASGGDILFSDDFTRPPDPDPVPFTWIIPDTSPSYPNRGTFDTNGGVLNTRTDPGYYGFAYTDTVTIADGAVEADIRFPQVISTQGGGIFGRLNPATGQRYGFWIYPETSPGNAATIRLIRFNNWGGWTGLATGSIPGGVGSDWHHVRMTFTGNQIQVFYDGSPTPIISATDGAYTSGHIGVGFWNNNTAGNIYGPVYNNFVVRDSSDAIVWSDDFGPDPIDPLLPWIRELGTWMVTDGALQAASTSGYAYVYAFTDPLWTDYTVEGRIQFPTGAFGGGIGGRVDPATGAHYGAWVYPDGSSGGSNVLKLVKFRDWTAWNGVPMQQVNLPSVGTDWHTLRMDFEGNRIRIYYDSNLMIDVTDEGYDSRPAYLSGGVSVDTWSAGGGAYAIRADDIVVRSPAEYGDSGTLLSSAFDGGVGVQWQNIAWNSAAGGSTGVRVRTRTADRADQLASAPWSDWYTTSGVPVTNEDRRWIQYELELTSSDPSTTPIFYENGITYIPGIQLPGSNLIYTGPVAGDSESQVTLSATLLDDNDDPIVGRTIDFTLSGVNGTLTTSGTTAASGEVSPPLDLMTAPSVYTLTVAFAGDAGFAPVSREVSFEVTSPWSEWVQNTQADFQSDTLTAVDVNTQPGSVLLEETLVGGGEESGSFSVGGVPGWSYRRGLFIDNNADDELPAAYSVRLVLDTAGLVSEGKLRADGDDLRVVWQDGTTQVELDRVAETAFNTASTEIWFKTQVPIPGNERDGSYYLYYGNPGAGAPPADRADVYALWDQFDGSSLDPRWSPQGTVTVSGGQAHLTSGANIIGTTPYTYALLEMRVQAGGENNYMWWGWEDDRGDAPNFIVFEEFPAPSGFEALIRNDGLPFSRLPISDPSDGLTTWHTYITDWWPGHARWLIDGAEVMNAADGVPDSPMYANFYARSLAINIDWVKARLRAAEEPTVSLSTPQPGYASQGQVLSIAYDTNQFSTWKYLTWEAAIPPNTNISLRLRTAPTQDALDTAPWLDYERTGLLIGNHNGRWVQYEATLSTTNPFITPQLHQVTVYYTDAPATLTVTPDLHTVAAGETVTYTASLDDGNDIWDVTGETDFSIDAGASGVWTEDVYTSQIAGTWTVTGQYLNMTDTANLTVEHASAVTITLTPAEETLMNGESVTYTVSAEDAYSNTWDATTETDFSIDAGAGGDWTDNVYTSQVAGDWTVTGDHQGVTGTAILHVTPVAGLAVAKTDSPDPVIVGSTLIYTITVTNYGPSDATGVSLSDDLPEEVTLSAVTASQGTCSQADPITCDLGTMTDGTTATVTIVVTPTTLGTITNTVSISQTEFDPNMTDNTAEESTTVNNPVPTTTGLSPDSVVAGSPGFTMIVTGTNFVSGSTVYWNGSALLTTFLSDTQLSAAVADTHIAAEGTISVTVVNPAPGGGSSNVYIFTVTSAAPPGSTIFLPIILMSDSGGSTPGSSPDLVVERITVTRENAEVIIKNQGETPVTNAFWVDLYVDPHPVPAGVNQTWNDGRCAQGMVWGVAGGAALPLDPGESVALHYGDAYYWDTYSHISWPLSGDAQIYVQVDSANTDTTYGAVLENHEMTGGAYNNIRGPASPALSGLTEEAGKTEAIIPGGHLPPRP
jgi:uncharacterized repeat protein (TIGR01451 family)